eukprot:TRINITY_DN764_c0_g1_i1.p1 TRINITY_DN764_c0_g1~~TRINITY_DN764_c0_g1_i1.p1  ORF type:complete len:170 (+),score=38.62 TRINITY_DN764_c0_g1_i1:125-634(+)
MSIECVKCVIVLDSDGARVLSRFYSKDFSTVSEQKAFEKNIFEKTDRKNGEIILLDGLIIIFRSIGDVIFYIVGGMKENEVILMTVIDAMIETLNNLLKNGIDKISLLQNFDVLSILVDELIDGGIIFETDPVVLGQRVNIAKMVDDLPIAEQTIGQALESLAKNLLKS